MKRVWLVLVLMLSLILLGCTQQVTQPSTPHQPDNVTEKTDFQTFTSERELREYIQNARFPRYGFFGVGLMEVGMVRSDVAGFGEKGVAVTPTPVPVPTPGRYSGTNVQVVGIDEPDIVKTDGANIYLSNWMYPIRFIPEIGRETEIIAAYPPDKLEKLYKIDDSGNLLLFGDVLIVISRDHISAYDVSAKPEKLWKIDLDSHFVSARLYNDSIYLITRKELDYYSPCPIKPLEINGKPLVVECKDIYHPVPPVYADTTYFVMKIDPESGEVEKSISFVGSLGQSVVYMSRNAIYVTYYKTPDQVKLMYDFLKQNRDLVSDEVIERIEKLLDYELSNQAKAVEIQVIIQQYASSLDKDERKKFENELWNRLEEYRKEHKRELEKTQIVKISLDLKAEAIGEVPGRLLNQFSLDEYNGYLRVATTVSDANDLYVLDGKMDVAGSILNFGEDERIYSVRFIGDNAYVVTFRETDPFFVMDLSDPRNPKMEGKLKIPGYSSYLHPLKDDLILGIGKEGRNVKISIFDVSNPKKPEEVSKYTLKEYWSDVLQTHHAFLLDPKHEVFFLPASTGGYVFSYKDGLELVRAIDMPTIRALYIDDYLYVIGQRIVVFDELTWEKVNEIDLV